LLYASDTRLTIVSIHQPNFLPWLGYFNKLLRSDIFILYDDVQFPRGKTVVNRVLIKTASGPDWITVPVGHRGAMLPIRDARISADDSWKRKVIRTIETSYARAPYLGKYLPGLRSIIEGADNELWRLNSALIMWCAQQLESSARLEYSSALCADQSHLSGSDKIHHLLKSTGATVYITGETVGSQRYLLPEWFHENNIQLEWQNFHHPRYPQQHGPFAEGLSVIDLLFNCGPTARSIVLGLSSD
jgi:WbqC-like protein family